MKKRKNILTIAIICAVAAVLAFRLVANKQSFDRELKLISESSGAIPVIVDTVKVQPVHTSFSADGIFYASKEISIAAELDGKVESLNCKEGDKVAAGEILATIDNKVYKSELDLAHFNLEKTEKDFARNEQLVKTDGVTMQQFEDAKKSLTEAKANLVSAQKHYDDSFIKAPFSGVITKRNIESGTYLSTGTEVFDMVKIDRVKLVVMLTSEEAASVNQGQKVLVSSEVNPEETAKGKVISVNVKADESGKYEAEIEVLNPANSPIKPGMFGKASFPGTQHTAALLIPRKAIAGSIKNAEVFLVKGDSVLLQKIEVSPLEGDNVMVNAGLKAGDVLVTSGQINLVDGSKIKFL